MRLRLLIVLVAVGLVAVALVTITRVRGRDSVGATLVAAAQTPATTVDPADVAATGPPLDEVAAWRVGVPDRQAAVEQEWDILAEAVARLAEAEAEEQAAADAQAATQEEAEEAAAAPAPAAGSTPAPSGGGSLYAKLDNIATCESGQNPKALNPAGPWKGAFQFHQSTWEGMGEKGDPRNKSYAYQREVAARLAQSAGFGSWPSCAAKYGYI